MLYLGGGRGESEERKCSPILWNSMEIKDMDRTKKTLFRFPWLKYHGWCLGKRDQCKEPSGKSAQEADTESNV
jgi:hypothetical protein